MSPVTYRLQLPKSLRIHDVFHVDLLIPYHETEEHGANYAQPPPELVDGEEEYEVEDIINERTSRRKKQYLVKWAGYPASEICDDSASVRRGCKYHPERPESSPSATLIIWHSIQYARKGILSSAGLRKGLRSAVGRAEGSWVKRA
jgi:hypothetical protein